MVERESWKIKVRIDSKATIKASLLLLVLLSFVFFIANLHPAAAPPNYTDKWWNASWHYRFRVDVNASNFTRIDWPVEYSVNMTSFLEGLGASGTFNPNSTRVVEYNSTGHALYEVNSQFDDVFGYNASRNAIGETVFQMNGTTVALQSRRFYVYFDINENGIKTNPNYISPLNASWDGIRASVNNTACDSGGTNSCEWVVHTNTSGGYSGLTRLGRGPFNYIFNLDPATQRSGEYIEYTNGTYNFTFNFIGNLSVSRGPVRVRLRQFGSEVISGQTNSTGDVASVKDYYFYDKIRWFKTAQNITNTANRNITRGSTYLGSPAIDFERITAGSTQRAGNSIDPGSWAWAAEQSLSYHIGIVNFNESLSNYTAFYADTASTDDRVGIHLNTSSIPNATSIFQTSVIDFHETEGAAQKTSNISEMLVVRPLIISQQSPEKLEVRINTTTNYTIYNRGEVAVITGDITFDPWNLTQYVNVSLDNATAALTDDIVLQLVKVNSTYYNTTYNITNTTVTGLWNATGFAFSVDNYTLNFSSRLFNITSWLSTVTTLNNPTGGPSRWVNGTVLVRNYRNDTYISSANVTCRFGSQYLQPSNITNLFNGTYNFNFTAPVQTQTYSLNCSSAYNNNEGWGAATFTVEAQNTTVSGTSMPESYSTNKVNFTHSNFTDFSVNASNFGNATAFALNITPIASAGWSLNVTNQSCGDVFLGNWCVRPFNITIPAATSPGAYVINISMNWTNFDGSPGYNTTNFTVYVQSNPVLVVSEASIANHTGPGKNGVFGNITLRSLGNDPITSVNITPIGFPAFLFSFNPATPISSISAGQNVTVRVNVTIPTGYPTGTYTGTLNVTTANDGFSIVGINVTVSGTNMSLSASPTQFTFSNITFSRPEFIFFYGTANNTGNVTAYWSAFNATLPSGWSANATGQECGNVTVVSSCTRGFNVTVPGNTPTGNYTIPLNITWTDIDVGWRYNTTFIVVNITENPLLNVTETSLANTSAHGTNLTYGFFTANSIGNKELINLSFNVTGIQNFTFTFSPPNITNFTSGATQVVQMYVSIPFGHNPGNYTGTLNVTTANNGFDTVQINVTVPVSLSWTINGTSCLRLQTPKSGVGCDFRVNNTGNLPITFNVTPIATPGQMVNYTWPNSTQFTVGSASNRNLSIHYDVNTAPGGQWQNVTYNISSLNSSVPVWRNVSLYLNPFVGPLVIVNTTVPSIEQNGAMIINAYVNDQSGAGSISANVTVVAPNGSVYFNNMFAGGSSPPDYTFFRNYPESWGLSLRKGTYTVIATARDAGDISTNGTNTFKVYAKVNATLNTLSSSYNPGNSGTINYVARDITGTGISSNVTLTIYNPSSLVIFQNSYQTDLNGSLAPNNPTFQLTSDAPTGTYILNAFTKHNDTNVNLLVNESKNYTFSVVPGSGFQGMQTDVETTVVWYPSSTSKYRMLVADASGFPITPTSMFLRVLRPDNIPLFTVSCFDGSAGCMTPEGLGIYRFDYALGPSPVTGDYWVIFNATSGSNAAQAIKAFRVASGGPYDAEITQIENQVPRGTNVDFTIRVENKGEGGQDVFIEYFIGSTFMQSETIFTPGLQNTTVGRSIFVFSSMSLGITNLTARVNYSTNVNNPPVSTSKSFEIIEAGSTTTTAGSAPPAGGGGGAPPSGSSGPSGPSGSFEAPSNLSIIEYSKELAVSKGFASFPSVKVLNAGGSTLRNIVLRIEGLPASWYTITPSSLGQLNPGISAVFSVRIQPPLDVRAGDYPIKFLATSDKDNDEKSANVLVFETKDDLLRYEIAKLKEELQRLKDDTQRAKSAGRDVKLVELLIPEIDQEIRNAEDTLNRGDSGSSLGHVTRASDLLRRARDLLNNAPYIFPVFALPWWLLVIIGILILIVIFLLLFLRRVREGVTSLLRKKEVEDATKVRASVTKTDSAAVQADIDRVRRVLSLLESEKARGLITERAYMEMKKRNEDKLNELSKKLK